MNDNYNNNNNYNSNSNNNNNKTNNRNDGYLFDDDDYYAFLNVSKMVCFMLIINYFIIYFYI